MVQLLIVGIVFLAKDSENSNFDEKIGLLQLNYLNCMVFIGDILLISMEGINRVINAIKINARFSQITVSQEISIGTKDT